MIAKFLQWFMDPPLPSGPARPTRASIQREIDEQRRMQDLWLRIKRLSRDIQEIADKESRELADD